MRIAASRSSPIEELKKRALAPGARKWEEEEKDEWEEEMEDEEMAADPEAEREKASIVEDASVGVNSLILPSFCVAFTLLVDAAPPAPALSSLPPPPPPVS